MAKNLTDTAQMFDYQVKSGANSSVLCTLSGYMTYHDKPNRNRRKYPNGFWQKQVDSERIREMLDTKTFFGEAKHPGKDDSPLVELPNVSHNIRELKVDDKGVYGVVDVLNTTQGRAIKTLVDYGSKIGISTRAFGKQDEDKDGNFIPDEDNYLLVTWDLVTFPAFSDARMAISDSVDFDITGAIGVSRSQIMDKIASLPEADARALCDATGIEFVPRHSSEISALRAQLDEAATRIAAIEAIGTKEAEEESEEEGEKKQAQQSDDYGDRLLSRMEESAKFNKQIADYLSERQTSIAEFDEVAAIAMSQKDELEALRSANVTLSSRCDTLALNVNELSRHRDELELLAEKMISDFELKSSEYEEAIQERDDEIETLEEQLAQTEAQVKDLLARSREKSKKLADTATTVRSAESRSAQPMFDSLLDYDTANGANSVTTLVNRLTKKRG